VRGRLQGRPAVVVVIGTGDGKPQVVVAVNEQAIDRGLAANDLIGVIGEHVGGRGGGKADVAQGGGSDVGGIDSGFGAVRDAIARTV
jgi:alanyl-tRNA synthetase